MHKKQKVIIVTGSSRGIGAATAIKAASLGYAVCINYCRDAESAKKVASKISKFNVPYILVKADVSKETQVEMLFKRVTEELGKVSALVNNVGVLQQKMPLVDMPSTRMESIINTNILSAFYCCQQAVRSMALSSGGHGGGIVNVSSAASRSGAPREYIDYAVSKGAIDTLTIGLSKEVAHEGIRVNCVRPGFIHTGIHRDGGEPNRVQRLAPSLPLQRGGEPEEVANAILWLLSNEASYVTGSFIDLAGGN